MKVLYCVNLEDNMNNIIALKYYKPDKVILIKEAHASIKTLEHFINYLESEGFKVPIETLNLNKETPFHLVGSKKDIHESIIILPADSTILGYELLMKLIKLDLHIAYVEDDGDIFELQGDSFTFVSQTTDIDVTDYISSRGGLVTSDSTILFGHKRIIELLNFIQNNRKDYLDLFRYANSKTPFYKSYPDNRNKLIMKPLVLKNNQQAFLLKLLKFMENQNIITVNQRLKNQVILTFKHKSYKSYLLKTGSWLEHRLFVLFKEIGIDDVEASLTFLWDKKRKANNEIDVMGVHHNKLIAVSCKDTRHIQPEYINELYTNTLHLSNDEALKMLFTTSDIPSSLQEKADEFNVHIIKYNYDNEATKTILKKIIFDSNRH